MKKQIITGPSMPTANLAINKSLLKRYETSGSMPTYYLNKGDSFQIELYNPTKDVILAKIQLNGKSISQGGLVIKPGERVFLDRYIDVPKKFLFDTYEVANTSEVKKAIEDNGDFKVEFFRESHIPMSPIYLKPRRNNYYDPYNFFQTISGTGTGTGRVDNLVRSGNAFSTNSVFTSFNHSDNPTYTTTSFNGDVQTNGFINISNAVTDSLNDYKSIEPKEFARKSKKIETGRVEMGSDSEQELEFVDMKFEYRAFHTIEYKMLPLSQKINTTDDLNIKRYCTNCSAKAKKEHKFCASCGNKL